jgi:SAM-dependent methyltransferase
MNESNAAQREAWERQVGAKWVANVDVMEHRLAPVTEVLLAQAAPRLGERVLDVGCGPGSLATLIADIVRTPVVAVDISETMLAVAAKRVPHSVELVRADAQAHAFIPPPFDLVVSRFGVMFFDEPVSAFRNLRRAMTSRGRLCFSAWGRLDENPHWSIPVEIATRRAGPRESSDPRAPGPLAFSDEGYVRGILEGAGFTGIAVEHARVELPGRAAHVEAEFSLTVGPAASLVEERGSGPDLREAIVREVTEAFRPYEANGACMLPATVLLVTASS